MADLWHGFQPKSAEGATGELSNSSSPPCASLTVEAEHIGATPNAIDASPRTQRLSLFKLEDQSPTDWPEGDANDGIESVDSESVASDMSEELEEDVQDAPLSTWPRSYDTPAIDDSTKQQDLTRAAPVQQPDHRPDSNPAQPWMLTAPMLRKKIWRDCTQLFEVLST